MPYVKDDAYRNLPFTEISKEEFFTHSDISTIISKCELFKDELFKCRSIGLLHSENGRFFLTDIASPVLDENVTRLRVTMVYLKSPPQPPVPPYPVQIFGTVHWKNRPVIFAFLLQVLTVPVAIRMSYACDGIAKTHLARTDLDCNANNCHPL